MKKALSLVLILVMLASMAVITASAAAKKIGLTNTTWEITGDTLTIAGTGAMPDNGDYTFTPWWDDQASIKKIVIKSGVTVIGKQSFCHFTALEEIVIEEGVTEIKQDAFAYINNDEEDNVVAIKKLTYPTTITTLAQGVFYSTGIEKVSCTKKLKEIKDATTAAAYNDALWQADWGEEKITSGTIPAVAAAEGVTASAEIKWAIKDGVLTVTGDGAMPNFKAGDAPWALSASLIKEIVVSDGITYVGNQSFAHMDACTKITFGKKVTALGADAMSYNGALKTVVFNAAITSIGQGTVWSTGNIENITVTGQTKEDFLAVAAVKVYNDNYKNATYTVVSAPVVPTTPTEYTEIKIAPAFGGFENWINSPNNPEGKGNGAGVTELLVGITDKTGATIDIDGKLTWKITIAQGTTKKTITIQPATIALAYNLYRFEPCLATGANQFVPAKDGTYTVSIEVYDGTSLEYKSNEAEFTCPMDPVVPAVQPPVTADATVYMIVVAVVALIGMAVVAVKKVNA